MYAKILHIIMFYRSLVIYGTIKFVLHRKNCYMEIIVFSHVALVTFYKHPFRKVNRWTTRHEDGGESRTKRCFREMIYERERKRYYSSGRKFLSHNSEILNSINERARLDLSEVRRVQSGDVPFSSSFLHEQSSDNLIHRCALGIVRIFPVRYLLFSKRSCWRRIVSGYLS